ncbi:MAG TPA: hypothetical protein VM100_04035 [Longimicrobiales bacterium]|nr:hypothetical protein [Longimicrobiales bacterium]
MIRYLLITRRRVPLEMKEEYARLWSAVRAVAEKLSARAWIFESAHVGGFYTEFVEWKSLPSDLLIDRAEASSALDDLNTIFIAEEAAVWSEAQI